MEIGKLLPGQDWIVEAEYYTVKVLFGPNDFARLVAVSNDLAARAIDLLGGLTKVNPLKLLSEGQADELLSGLANVADSAHRTELWQAIDELLVRAIREWSLADFAATYKVAAPKQFCDCTAEERLEVIRALPVKTVGRVFYALLWHAGN